jgi:predicted phosphodiesterase
MIYVTGDCHGNFHRFTKKRRNQNGLSNLGKGDYVIVCGDLGLLWAKDRELEYNLDWMSRLQFTLLWVQGNHENYDLIAEYPIEMWHGGKVRHILKDKVILLERGQVFDIDGKTIFTFGGASSHDIQGGILDRNSETFQADKIYATKMGLPYRIINESWWIEELPTPDELDEGIENLEKVNWTVDYVITHCAPDSIEKFMGRLNNKKYTGDILTEYFEKIEDKLKFKHWYFGHYHMNKMLDDKHTVLYEDIVTIDSETRYKELEKAFEQGLIY